MKKKPKLKKILILFASAYAVFIIVNTQLSIIRIKKEIQAGQQELSKAKDKNEKLQDEVNMSKTDAYIEKLARERLGLIKEGETPVINKK